MSNGTNLNEGTSPQKSSDSAPHIELTSFQQNIIAVLAEEPMYGLAIKRGLEEYYGKEVHHGRLYPNLDDLVELGLVEKRPLDKRTNEYELTREGTEYLEGRVAWMNQHLDGPAESATAAAARTDGGDEQ